MVPRSGASGGDRPPTSRPAAGTSRSPLQMPSVRDGRSRPSPAGRRPVSGPSPDSRRRTDPHGRPRASCPHGSARPAPRTAQGRFSEPPTRADRGAARTASSRLRHTGASHGAAPYAAPHIQASPLAASRRPPFAVIVFVVVALLAAAVFGIDQIVNGSRIYQGVSVGSVDVSGMTADEARSAVAAAYGDRLSGARGYIFASEEARGTVDVDTELAEQAAQAEQLSVEEARADKKLWVAEAGALGARIPVSELVDEAFAVGRATGPGGRLQAATGGVNVPVRLSFDDEAVEALASDIDESIGRPRQDWDIEVDDEGRASLVEGHDGTIVDRTELTALLTQGFLAGDSSGFSFVAEAGYAPLRIDEEAAERTRAAVQAVLDEGIAFTFEGDTWQLSGRDIAPWIATDVEAAGEGFYLAPHIDDARARADIVQMIRDAGFATAVTVSFEVAEGEVWVSAASGSRYPLVADALADADEMLFGSFDGGGSFSPPASPSVEIGWGAAPERTTFDEAIQCGLIGEISSFTTEYNDGAGTASRRHNIHRAADLLTDSVAAAQGGQWSFNAVMGEANEGNGFQAAHAIVNGEYEDAIGGGICQVATTVFNAVFEAGYPVTERRNHSLYISSYPTGRDAAIAYPDLDLTWVNDGTSDVLLRTRYTDSSLTVTLYGVDPGYVVASQTGEWTEGDPFGKRVVIDENEPEGTRYVKTAGADGRCVTVHRTVRDRAGTVLHEEDFASSYAPIDEVTVVGPNTPTAEEEEADEGSESPGTDKEDARVSTGD